MSSGELGFLGPYRLLEVANVGQSTRLWRAYDDRTKECVGLKTLLNTENIDKSQVDILKWEYTVAGKFEHPRVIRAKEFGWDKKVPYLAVEWFLAPNLKAFVNKGYMSYAEQIPAMFKMMTESLAYMHQNGWVHRDVKPDNFLFAVPNVEFEEPRLKLIDFGISKKTVGGFISVFTKVFGGGGKVQGTGSYISPEQILRKAPEPSADIYSLGCSFFELITGKLPFAAGSMNELLEKHLSAPMPSLSARNKNVTEDMSELIRQMMHKKAEMRMKNASEVLIALKKIRIFKRKPSESDV